MFLTSVGNQYTLLCIDGKKALIVRLLDFKAGISEFDRSLVAVDF